MLPLAQNGRLATAVNGEKRSSVSDLLTQRLYFFFIFTHMQLCTLTVDCPKVQSNGINFMRRKTEQSGPKLS